MEATDILSNFWTSILGKGFEKELSVVMNFKDPEEKIVQLLSRMLFIVTLEIKSERDDAVYSNKKLEEELKMFKESEDKGSIIKKSKNIVESDTKKETGYRTCKRLRFRDDVQNADESDDDIIPNTVMENGENLIETISITGRGKRNRNVESDDAQNSHKKSCNVLDSIKNSPEYSHPRNTKENKPDKSLSRSQRKKNKCHENDKNKILAPETQFLNENAFYLDVNSRKELATQTVSVPETMQMTEYLTAQSDNYNNTDFYDAGCTMDSETQIDGINKVKENQQNNKPGTLLQLKADALQSLESPSKQNLATPVVESQKLLSPVLGKASKANTTNSHRSSSKKITSPKKSTPVKKITSPKEPLKQLQINTPSQVLSPGTKYTPLLFKQDLNGSTVESDQESPSLLPWNNYINLPRKNEIETDAALTLATQPTEFREPEKGLFNKRNTLLRKTKSSFDASTPKTSSESIFRGKRSRMMQAPRGGHEMTVELPLSPESRKNYKQIKITAQIFAPKKTDLARITGGDRGAVSNPVANNDDPILEAIALSIKTAEVEAMMREKKEQLMKEKDKNFESVDMAGTNRQSAISFTSPKKVRNKLQSQETLRRSPRKSQRSPPQTDISLKKITKSPMKKKIKVSASSAIQDDLIYKCFGSPSKVNQDVESQEHILGLTECVEAVSQNCKSEETKTRPKTEVIEPMFQDFKVPQTKSKLKRKPSRVDNSFDMYSMKVDNEPGYAYKNAVVRKQSDRKKLEGVSCKECEDYYKMSNLTDTQLQTKMNGCSRHRVKHKPTTNTPPGFWDADWDTQDDAK